VRVGPPEGWLSALIIATSSGRIMSCPGTRFQQHEHRGLSSRLSSRYSPSLHTDLDEAQLGFHGSGLAPASRALRNSCSMRSGVASSPW